VPARWVKTVCDLPLIYRTGEKSIRQHFEPARPHLGDSTAFLAAVAARLRRLPDLIDAWRQYCHDKRTTGPYLNLELMQVGLYEVSQGCHEVRVHDAPVTPAPISSTARRAPF
jgi:hypothetical protein